MSGTPARSCRLVVKEILVGDDTIVIRHAFPSRPDRQTTPRAIAALQTIAVPSTEGYLLRSRSDTTPPCGVPLSRA